MSDDMDEIMRRMMVLFVAAAGMYAAVIKLSFDGKPELTFELVNLVLVLTVFVAGMSYERLRI